MRISTLIFLVSLAFTILTVVSAQGTGRVCRQGGAPPAECSAEGQYEWDNIACNWKCKNTTPGPIMCIQGGAPPAECSAEGQYQWDNIACKWICKRPVQCLINPCENADREGACPMAFCTPDYSTGCNFKCSKPNMCIQGGAPPAECSAEGQYQWDNIACKWICKRPVQCLVNPCENADREGACPMAFCTPDYSTGCNFKCSKPNICVQGGALPPQCSAPGQAEWDNKACKWVCTKCVSNEGSLVSIGDKYFNECNSCTCLVGGQGGCTKKGCSGLGVCFDDKGNGYKVGDTIKQKCNTCTCGENGQWGCTKMACPSGPDMCILGGKVPAECPTTNVWDSKACRFICQTPPSTCARKCATTKCVSGSVCEQDQNCVVKCTIVVISATFRVTMTKNTNTVVDVVKFMTNIAGVAGQDVLAAFSVSNNDITKVTGNSANYKWSVKIGIKAATEIERVSLLERYVAEAKNTNKVAKTNNINTDDATATDGSIDSEYDLTTEEPMMAMQSCPDGSQISAADECPIDTFAVPATSSSSSSSTPLVAIIVPIVAGVVLIAVIATAVVVLRRRANTIKSINNVQQDTQMAQRV